MAKNILHYSLPSGDTLALSLMKGDSYLNVNCDIEDIRNIINSPIVAVRYRIFVLFEDETINYEIPSSDIKMGGSYSENYQSGQRRSFSCSLVNETGKYSPGVNSLWAGTKFKLEQGLVFEDNQIIWFSKGVYRIQTINPSYSDGDNSVSITAADKFSIFESKIGTLDSTYTINAGSDVEGVILDILRTTQRTTTPLDPATINYHSSLKNKKTQCDITKNEGETFGTILKELANQINAEIFYDSLGKLTLVPINDIANDEDKTILEYYTDDKGDYNNFSLNYNMDEIINKIIVIGSSSKGGVYRSEAVNDNPESLFCVQRIGQRVGPVINDSSITAQYLANERAQYELRKTLIIRGSTSLTVMMNPLLSVNNLVCITNEFFNLLNEKFIIQSISYSLDYSGTMTISIASLRNLAEKHVTVGTVVKQENETDITAKKLKGFEIYYDKQKNLIYWKDDPRVKYRVYFLDFQTGQTKYLDLQTGETYLVDVLTGQEELCSYMESFQKDFWQQEDRNILGINSFLNFKAYAEGTDKENFHVEQRSGSIYIKSIPINNQLYTGEKTSNSIVIERYIGYVPDSLVADIYNEKYDQTPIYKEIRVGICRDRFNNKGSYRNRFNNYWEFDSTRYNSYDDLPEPQDNFKKMLYVKDRKMAYVSNGTEWIPAGTDRTANKRSNLPNPNSTEWVQYGDVIKIIKNKRSSKYFIAAKPIKVGFEDANWGNFGITSIHCFLNSKEITLQNTVNPDGVRKFEWVEEIEEKRQIKKLTLTVAKGKDKNWKVESLVLTEEYLNKQEPPYTQPVSQNVWKYQINRSPRPNQNKFHILSKGYYRNCYGNTAVEDPDWVQNKVIWTGILCTLDSIDKEYYPKSTETGYFQNDDWTYPVNYKGKIQTWYEKGRASNIRAWVPYGVFSDQLYKTKRFSFPKGIPMHLGIKNNSSFNSDLFYPMQYILTYSQTKAKSAESKDKYLHVNEWTRGVDVTDLVMNNVLHDNRKLYRLNKVGAHRCYNKTVEDTSVTNVSKQFTREGRVIKYGVLVANKKGYVLIDDETVAVNKITEDKIPEDPLTILVADNGQSYQYIEYLGPLYPYPYCWGIPNDPNIKVYSEFNDKRGIGEKIFSSYWGGDFNVISTIKQFESDIKYTDWWSFNYEAVDGTKYPYRFGFGYDKNYNPKLLLQTKNYQDDDIYLTFNYDAKNHSINSVIFKNKEVQLKGLTSGINSITYTWYTYGSHFPLRAAVCEININSKKYQTTMNYNPATLENYSIIDFNKIIDDKSTDYPGGLLIKINKETYVKTRGASGASVNNCLSKIQLNSEDPISDIIWSQDVKGSVSYFKSYQEPSGVYFIDTFGETPAVTKQIKVDGKTENIVLQPTIANYREKTKQTYYKFLVQSVDSTVKKFGDWETYTKVGSTKKREYWFRDAYLYLQPYSWNYKDTPSETTGKNNPIFCAEGLHIRIHNLDPKVDSILTKQSPTPQWVFTEGGSNICYYTTQIKLNKVYDYESEEPFIIYSGTYQQRDNLIRLHNQDVNDEDLILDVGENEYCILTKSEDGTLLTTNEFFDGDPLELFFNSAISTPDVLVYQGRTTSSRGIELYLHIDTNTFEINCPDYGRSSRFGQDYYIANTSTKIITVNDILDPSSSQQHWLVPRHRMFGFANELHFTPKNINNLFIPQKWGDMGDEVGIIDFDTQEQMKVVIIYGQLFSIFTNDNDEILIRAFGLNATRQEAHVSWEVGDLAQEIQDYNDQYGKQYHTIEPYLYTESYTNEEGEFIISPSTQSINATVSDQGALVISNVDKQSGVYQDKYNYHFRRSYIFDVI